ncbi:MAG: DNA polymerase III subunit beta, partial [Rhodocyclaceae bacterium]|nr:DNA polymerase III subunit beta [Rhodocyclaceae bacterium]
MSHFLKTTRNNLLHPLQAVANIVEKRHTLPILSNVLLEKSGENLTLTATDADIQVKTSTAGEIGGENGEITANARKLLDILRALPETADVQLSLEANRMSIRAGKARFTLQTLPATDYPRMKIEAENAARIHTSQQTFKALLDQVAYAMAQQDIR